MAHQLICAKANFRQTSESEGLFTGRNSRLERDAEKWNPVFRANHASTKKLEQDDFSTKHHPALAPVRGPDFRHKSLKQLALDLGIQRHIAQAKHR